MTHTPWAGELCFPRPSRTVWWDGAGAMWTSFSRGWRHPVAQGILLPRSREG